MMGHLHSIVPMPAKGMDEWMNGRMKQYHYYYDSYLLLCRCETSRSVEIGKSRDKNKTIKFMRNTRLVQAETLSCLLRAPGSRHRAKLFADWASFLFPPHSKL